MAISGKEILGMTKQSFVCKQTGLFEYIPHWQHMHRVRDLDTSTRIVEKRENPT